MGVMRGKSDVSRLSGGISSDHEFGDYLRRLLRAAVEPIEPADGGLKRIRARLGPAPAAGSRRARVPVGSGNALTAAPAMPGWPGSRGYAPCTADTVSAELARPGDQRTVIGRFAASALERAGWRP